jgi:nanoRNase/pAp phosphatase (c-di-AMP/oligoRNAs hydrolase)
MERSGLWKAAEHLLGLQQINTVLVGGIIGDHVDISVRTYDGGVTPKETLRKAYPEIEESKDYGGRYDKGGGRIPMSVFGAVETMSDLDKCFVVDRYLKTRFYDSVGIKEETKVSE